MKMSVVHSCWTQLGCHSIREYVTVPTSLHPCHPSSDSVDMCLPRNEQFPLRVVQSVRSIGIQCFIANSDGIAMSECYY